MQTAREDLAKTLIHLAMASDEREALESGAHDDDCEVRLGARGDAVLVALVVDPEVGRVEGGGETVVDVELATHGVSWNLARVSVDCIVTLQS